MLICKEIRIFYCYLCGHVYFNLKNNRSFVSRILLGIYLFVFILSGSIHTHEEEHCKDKVTTHFHAQDEHANDCMSCHLLYSSHFVLPQNFGFAAKSVAYYQELIPYQESYVYSVPVLFVFLRGPPMA
ncbi:MAG: hypothetical protein KBA33_06915 [Cloacibacterium sp.]|nr:hypothetical protein [Cloacibacterium sp.]